MRAASISSRDYGKILVCFADCMVDNVFNEDAVITLE